MTHRFVILTSWPDSHPNWLKGVQPDEQTIWTPTKVVKVNLRKHIFITSLALCVGINMAIVFFDLNWDLNCQTRRDSFIVQAITSPFGII